MFLPKQALYRELIRQCQTLEAAALLDDELATAEGDDPVAMKLRSELEVKMATRIYTSLNVAQDIGGRDAWEACHVEGGLRLHDLLRRKDVLDASKLIEEGRLKAGLRPTLEELLRAIVASETTTECLGAMQSAHLALDERPSWPADVEKAMLRFLRAQAKGAAHEAMHAALSFAWEDGEVVDEAFLEAARRKAQAREEATMALLLEIYKDDRRDALSEQEWRDRVKVEEIIQADKGKGRGGR